VLSAAGAAFGDRAGGTSGILWGVLLDAIGQGLGNTEAVTDERVAAAVQRAVEKLQTFSKAEQGDKTMLDALFPFADTLVAEVDAGRPLGAAWQHAAEVAVAAAQETASLTPKIGRARPLAERSIGTPDPGAVSLGMIVTAVGVVLAEPSRDDDSR
jgi:dihydroxyacetone kinase